MKNTGNPPRKPEISVCVCAYRRPDDLHRLLESLVSQVPQTPLYEIVVVDNDATGSSAAVAGDFANARIPVRYFVEPEQNIARARNRSLAEAQADLIAIIDDDEIAEPDWLLELYRALLQYKADAAFGPVHSRFVTPPPQWIIDGGFFDYSPIPTGLAIPLESTRTSNVLLRRSALPSPGDVFDVKLGLTGGSDTDLFRRMLESGAMMIAVETAVVHETVTEERACLKWLAARWFRYGTLRLCVLENRQRTFKHRMKTAGMAIRGFFANLGRATRYWRNYRGISMIELVHASYWWGVIASLFGYTHMEYTKRQTSARPTASVEQARTK